MNEESANAIHRSVLPSLCEAPHDKGKVESGVKYVRYNFWQGVRFRNLDHLNEQMNRWLTLEANARIHGTTYRMPREMLCEEDLIPLIDTVPFIVAADPRRKVGRDCLVSYDSSKYSIPWQYANREVAISDSGAEVRIFCAGELAAEHRKAQEKHGVMMNPEHYRGIPRVRRQDILGGRQIITMADFDEVEKRSLKEHDDSEGGGLVAMLEVADELLEALGLDEIRNVLPTRLERAANTNMSYSDFLVDLLTTKRDAKRNRYIKTRTTLAHFPFIRTLEQFDFSFQPSIDERQIRELTSLSFIAECSNAIFLGPPGVGKTHLAVALGIEAISRGIRPIDSLRGMSCSGCTSSAIKTSLTPGSFPALSTSSHRRTSAACQMYSTESRHAAPRQRSSANRVLPTPGGPQMWRWDTLPVTKSRSDCRVRSCASTSSDACHGT